jgi:hypothetical protein
LLLIVSDHGFSHSGTHYSCHDYEVCNAFLFAYNKRGFNRFRHKYQEIMTPNKLTIGIKETSIASTISALLGIPIPYLNIGRHILDLYQDSNNEFEYVY